MQDSTNPFARNPIDPSGPAHRSSAFGRDRTDLGCWHCKSSIPDDNPECATCWWRVCGCGACRQPTHIDTRKRIGPCPEEVERLGLALRMWPRTFLDKPIDWPTSAELNAGPLVKEWLARLSGQLGIRIRLLDTDGFHPNFGLRLEVPASVNMLDDVRMASILRAASNLSGHRDLMIERPAGDRMTFVLGEGLFARVQGQTFSAPHINGAHALEDIESRGVGLRQILTGH